MNLNVIMTKEEFLTERTPVFVHPETGSATIVNNTNLKDKDFAEIFSNLKIGWFDTTRGYIYKDRLMLYVNDYELPRFAVGCCVYFFNFFPDIEWIGLGCNKGKPGEVWSPKLIVKRGGICSF